ncbi:MAG: quinone-dependent dihydroorotate dehydrogenase [Hyphomicrobiaceae bacterium]
MIPKRLFDLAGPALRLLDAESAHLATLQALERGLYPRRVAPDPDALATTVMGLRLPNPIGMAAGFDKDARVPDVMLDMGFGFAEVGTLTPRPQTGNARPRAFRLPEDEAIINRNGFNNQGHAAALLRLSRRRNPARGVVGVNLGANKDSADRIADYVTGVEAFAPYASYFMINVSSPNTPGLRDLQAPGAIAALLEAVCACRDRVVTAAERRIPITVKLAPDIAEADLPAICDRLLGLPIDAIAISNTTIARPAGLRSRPDLVAQAGGLSGRPLFDVSTAMLARVRVLTCGRLPLIGIGGIDSGTAALQKIEAGADLVQVYTGFVYRGPSLLDDIKAALLRRVQAAGVGSIADLVGTGRDAWAAQPMTFAHEA